MPGTAHLCSLLFFTCTRSLALSRLDQLLSAVTLSSTLVFSVPIVNTEVDSDSDDEITVVTLVITLFT
jgi:hypothetical protein